MKLQLYKETTITHDWVSGAKKRWVVVQGGTSSGKSEAIMRVLLQKAIETPQTKITIVAETYSVHERDSIAILKSVIEKNALVAEFFDDRETKKTRGTFTLKNKSTLRFVAIDQTGKARYGKQDYTYFNELNNIDKKVVDTMAVRTAKQIYADFNSDIAFWVHEELKHSQECDFFITNYTHNKFAAQAVINELLKHKANWLASGDRALYARWEQSKKKEDFKAWDATSNAYYRNLWFVLGCGLTGTSVGAIFQDVAWVTIMPQNLQKEAYFLDWGFHPDPCAVGRAGIKEGVIYAEELIYKRNLTTNGIISHLVKLGVSREDLIICDSANPTGIADLVEAGFRAVGVVKNAGSVVRGLNGLMGHKLAITQSSENWKIERRMYKWQDKQNGKPIDAYNHLWDGLRYWWLYHYDTGISNKTGARPIGQRGRRRYTTF